VRFGKVNTRPPEGTRSVGITRAHSYGSRFHEYVESANAAITVVVQVEHIDAVKNLESILSVPGVDSVFVGPYDLSGSMGKTGAVSDPEVQAAISQVKSTCVARGVPVGIFARDVAAAKRVIADGFTLVAVGMDTTFFGDSIQQTVKALR
jgi:2-keto-3-deoxy-L-rhamnonate aldolase RhmA